MNPSATHPPIESIPFINEKSFLVIKTVVVIPPTKRRVIIQAVGINPEPPNMVAIKRRGRKTIASAITKGPRPR